MATFIRNNNNEKEYMCNICTDKIDNNEIIALECNPLKHIFCFDCISSWYKELKIHKRSGHQFYTSVEMCPICLKSGGALPNLESIKCNMILKNNKQCSYSGKKNYNGLCTKHWNKSHNEEKNCCNAPLKKNGMNCLHEGKQIYGGFCGIHKKLKDLENIIL
jgi:hypothetical protein